MKSVINFFGNLFTSKKEQEEKIETIDPISYPGTINPCGCDDCQCGKKTYIINVGAMTSEEAEKSLAETIASFKEEVIILPEGRIKKKDSNNSSKGKEKKKKSETFKK
jgi:hypothetical protein